MAVIKTTKIAKDAAATPTPFNLGVVDETSIGGDKASYSYLAEPALGALIVPAQDGIDASGIAAYNGGVGIRGWLSAIFDALSHRDMTATAAAPGTIAGTSNWLSALMTTRTKNGIAVGVTSTQAGAINVQRYIDAAGLVPQGGVQTATLAANTAAALNILTGEPFQSFTVQITNTSGVTATLTNFCLLLPAAA